MATFSSGKNDGKSSKVMDVDVMVTNTLKKLALQKEKSNDPSSGTDHEIMRSNTSIQDFKRKFSSIEESQTNSSKSSSIIQSPTTSMSVEPEYHSHQQFGTVDDMVNNTLKKLEKKKSSATSPVDDNHDKEGSVMRPKISVAEFRNRFSDSSEPGKEGYNSLETTPVGRKNKYSYPESEKEVILEDINGMESSGRNLKNIYSTEKNVISDRKNLNLNLSETNDTRIRVNRKPSHPTSQQQSHGSPMSYASPAPSPSKKKILSSPSVEIANYDKERESTLKRIQHGELLRQSPVRDQLENIVQTKVNSLNFQYSQTEENVTIPKPAPRKVSPKNHQAPTIPSTPVSVEPENIVIEREVINKKEKTEDKKISRNKKTSAPLPPKAENRSQERKEKINIKITNFDSSGTNYSTLERKNL